MSECLLALMQAHTTNRMTLIADIWDVTRWLQDWFDKQLAGD